MEFRWLARIANEVMFFLRRAIIWKNANWCVAGLWTLAGIMLRIDRFTLAIAFLSVAAVWIIVLWWRSDMVKRLQRISGRRSVKVSVRSRQYAGVMFIVLINGFVINLIGTAQIEHELQALKGFLLPANDPFPPSSCGNIDQNHIAIFLGSQISVTSKFPHKIVEVERVPRVVVDRDKNGRLILIADFLSADGRVIARLDKEGFVINQNNFLRMKRDDRSSLSVEDQAGHVVLKARYLNTRAFSLEAVLRYKNRVITFTGNKGSGNCFVDTGNADIAINPDIAIN